MKVLFFLFVLLLSWSGSSFSVSRLPVPLVNDSAATEVLEKLKVEVLQLSEQNKLLREHQGAMLSTVYWSLGVVVSIVILLMGYSIFMNLRFYEQDKLGLKSEIQSVIDKYQADVLLLVKQERLESERVIEVKNQNALNTILGQNTELQNRLDAVREDLNSEMKIISIEVVKVPAELDAIKKSILKAEVEIRAVEAMVWEARGVHSNSLLAQIEGVRAAAEAGSEVKLKYALDRMSNTLDRYFIEAGVRPSDKVLQWGDEALVLSAVLCPEQSALIVSKIDTVKSIVQPV